MPGIRRGDTKARPPSTMEILLSTEVWISLLTLTALEIVLGVDNLVFLSVVSNRLPEDQRPIARKVGLILACLMRIGLLFSIAWLTRLEKPLFTLFEFEASIRDLVLIGGGMFLIAKGTSEIHHTVEGEEASVSVGVKAGMAMVIAQIALLDLVFSLDSVITAVGLVEHVWIMVVAIVIAILLMIFAADPLANFIDRHPTIKMLALSFLLLVGAVLVADGFHFHVPRGYIYFAIAFSVFVESLNFVMWKRREDSNGKGA